MHKTLIYLVFGADHIVPLPQDRYVRLVRGEDMLPDHAGETLRLADLYVASGAVPRIERATYSLLSLDQDGRVVWPAAAVGANVALANETPGNLSWSPTDEEQQRLLELALGA